MFLFKVDTFFLLKCERSKVGGSNDYFSSKLKLRGGSKSVSEFVLL